VIKVLPEPVGASVKKLIMALAGTSALVSMNVTVISTALAQPAPTPASQWTGFYGGLVGGIGGGMDVEANAGAFTDPGVILIPGGGSGTCVIDEVYYSECPTSTLTLTVTELDGPPPEAPIGAAALAPLSGLLVEALEDFSVDDESWSIGVQAGYDHQVGNFLFGIVADINATDLEGGADFEFPEEIGFGSEASIDASLEWYGTVRGRIGLPFDRFLVYGTGGFAWGQIDVEFTSDITGPSETYEDDDWATGWAAGGGIAFLVTENISIDLSYLHVDLGSTEFVFDADTDLTFGSADVDVELDLFRFGANYRF